MKVKTRDSRPRDSRDVDPRYANGATRPGKELVVEEDIEVEEKDPRILKTLLTGLPSPSSTLWSAATFLINVALVLMTTDLVYRNTYFYPSHDLSMARVGYVSDTTAKVLVREPDAHNYPVFCSYRYADEPRWTTVGSSLPDTAWKSGGRIDWMDDRTDFTGTFSITGLKPDTRYQYTAGNHTGYFTTAPLTGEISTRASHNNQFTFVHSSCLKLNFPYVPFRHPLSAPGLRYFARAMKDIKAQFMLFLGDFIYIDVPHRHGILLEDYRREYRQVYSSPDWPAAASELPWIHVYDDHEIQNDWDGTSNIIRFFLYSNVLMNTQATPPASSRQQTTHTSTTTSP